MAVATVLTLSVSGAPSGVALLGRVVGAVVVGALTYVGAAGARSGPAGTQPSADAAEARHRVAQVPATAWHRRPDEPEARRPAVRRRP